MESMVTEELAEATKKRKFLHKYRPAWEDDVRIKNWIGRSDKGGEKFLCKYCLSDYACGTGEVIKHMNTKKHAN